MKTPSVFAMMLLGIAVNAQSQVAGVGAAAGSTASVPTPWAVVSRDANSAVWQRTTYDQGPNGTVVTNVHSYTELATGLNHLVNGQWVPSKEEIDISADGSSAMATNGQHQVYFPGNIYSGDIKLVTPDGKVLQSQPIGLSYFDGTNSVLLAVVTNSTGAILSSGNQVIYTNTFAGLDADLLYTYTKAGMEQDVVLRQQPPDPVSLGLDSASTRLQILTKFVSAPQPSVMAATVPTAAGNLEDDNLSFGVMAMGQGRAFLLGTNSPPANVEKRWLTLNGRQFLLEEVPIVSIAQAIDSLPPFTAQTGLGKPLVSKNLILPPPRLVHTTPKNVFLARAEPPENGLVLDYVTLSSSTNNCTFQGDTTYYLSGAVNLTGTATFEGGAVLKYTNNASLNLSACSQINCLAGPYRPVIFTAVNDNSVGQQIVSGSPSGYYANPAIYYFPSGSGSLSLSHFRITYANEAVYASAPTMTVSLQDGQIVNCSTGFYTPGQTSASFENMLFANVQLPLDVYLAYVQAQNVTFIGSYSALVAPAGSGPYYNVTVNLVNCILANFTVFSTVGTAITISGQNNGFYNDYTSAFGSSPITSTSNPFQTVGAGNYYLTSNCVFASAGTTNNIDPALLAGLRTKTVYAPAVVQTNWTTSGTWVPLVPRDTNSPPALGYHYAPIDYAVDGVSPGSSALTLSNGVAVAIFQAGNMGFNIGAGLALTSVGTATAHNQICYYTAVQEEPVQWGSTALSGVTLVKMYGFYGYPSSNNIPAFFTARFTDFNGCGGLGYLVSSYLMQFSLRDCQIGPGRFQADLYSSSSEPCINNLFERTGIQFSDDSGTGPMGFYNNLIRYGGLTFTKYETEIWQVENNLFDTTTNQQNIYGSGFSEDHNGYLNTSQMTPTNANDVVMTNFTYATGPLGNYYQASTTLIDKGSTTADQLGLFHYTTQTNQMIEGFSIVDIGYHYVAVDQNGNPLVSNTAGIPDYLADANGNGLVDNGETPWTTDSNLDGLSSQQKSLYGDNPNVSEAFWIWLSTPTVTSGIP
jgi:hypothetical protein